MIRSLLLALGLLGASLAQADVVCPPLLHFSARSLEGQEPIDLCKAYAGKVVLVVNTASQCGYTGQLKGLESLYRQYRDRGLVILGFPSNDFRQEHDAPGEIARVARQDYGVSFPLFERSAVSGEGANPFFKALASESGVTPKWNFQKYLISREGRVLKAYPSQTAPDDPLFLIEIEAALAAH
jgi:glutathione peroxidase